MWIDRNLLTFQTNFLPLYSDDSRSSNFLPGIMMLHKNESKFWSVWCFETMATECSLLSTAIWQWLIHYKKITLEITNCLSVFHLRSIREASSAAIIGKII